MVENMRAQDLARDHEPHLILLDLHLPDITGEEVMRRLQADPTTNRIPILVLSADATQDHIDRLLSTGATAYLTKPFAFGDLLRTIDGLLNDPHQPPASGAGAPELRSGDAASGAGRATG
jgi:DNA-binding response OmpR family regulator